MLKVVGPDTRSNYVNFHRASDGFPPLRLITVPSSSKGRFGTEILGAYSNPLQKQKVDSS